MTFIKEGIPRRIVVPSFGTVPEVKEALRKKDSHEPADLYPRDGTLALAALEHRFEGLVGLRRDSLVLYGNGMLSVTDALEATRPTVGATILHGQQLYSKAKRYINTELRGRGVTIRSVDAGSLEDISEAIDRHNPDILFFETVSNGPDMPVLDVDGLLGLEGVKRRRPLIILDHTLPTASLLPPARILEAHPDNLLIVESGTKFYGLNGEMAGLSYTYDQKLLDTLKDRRQTVGTLLSGSAVETIAALLPSKEEFDWRNRRIADNTYRLAAACAEGLEDSSRYMVTHPAFPTHPNGEYVQDVYLNGGTPVFFIQVLDGLEKGQFLLTDILDSDPIIHVLVEMRQSFGFDKYSMWPDANFPALRFAGGIEGEEGMALLEKACKRTLASTGDRKVFVNGFGEKPRVISLDGWEVEVRAQQAEDDCGQTLLRMWGYKNGQLPEEPISNLDLEWTFGGTEVSLEEAVAQDIPVMVLGVKKSTGNNHWFALSGDKVINPEGGLVLDRETYLRDEIGEVITAYQVPFAKREEVII